MMNAKTSIASLMVRVGLVAVFGCICASGVFAQGTQRPALRSYPTSSLITSQPLSSEKRAILEQLFAKEISPSTLKNRTLELCPPNLLHQPAVDDTTKKGLGETHASIAAQVQFRRVGEKVGLEPNLFSIVVEFSPSRVLLRHLSPRFPSDAAGFTAPMADAVTRPVRLEGKLGTDILALVPPLRECGVQGVLLCPRRYAKGDELRVAPYVVDAVRPLVSMKADGVCAPPAGTSGKVMVSLLASAGIALPTPWFFASSGSGTVSQAIEFTAPRDPNTATQAPLAATALPVHLAVESRVDLGREEGSVRTMSKRMNLELSGFNLTELHDLEVGTSQLAVEGGTCYLLSEWREEILTSGTQS